MPGCAKFFVTVVTISTISSSSNSSNSATLPLFAFSRSFRRGLCDSESSTPLAWRRPGSGKVSLDLTKGSPYGEWKTEMGRAFQAQLRNKDGRRKERGTKGAANYGRVEVDREWGAE